MVRIQPKLLVQGLSTHEVHTYCPRVASQFWTFQFLPSPAPPTHTLRTIILQVWMGMSKISDLSILLFTRISFKNLLKQ